MKYNNQFDDDTKSKTKETFLDTWIYLWRTRKMKSTSVDDDAKTLQTALSIGLTQYLRTWLLYGTPFSLHKNNIILSFFYPKILNIAQSIKKKWNIKNLILFNKKTIGMGGGTDIHNVWGEGCLPTSHYCTVCYAMVKIMHFLCYVIDGWRYRNMQPRGEIEHKKIICSWLQKY